MSGRIVANVLRVGSNTTLSRVLGLVRDIVIARTFGAGASADETIIAATVTAAEALMMENQIGTIEAGKSADIIALEGNPLEDVALLMNIDFVMARGEVAKD